MKFRLFLLAACTLALSGCGDVRETMGLKNDPPDEFAVVDHPPLSMPPDFSLHPPRPGEAPFQVVQPSQEAAQVLYGAGKTATPVKSGSSSTSEQALLNTSGGKTADPNIRTTIDHEAGQVVANRKLIDAVMFWREPKPAPSTVVDPVAERKRIEDAKKKNAPVTTGATPVIGPKKDEAVQ